ncbi:MAG: nicotinate-nucleotide adenylyltransferase [Firmicutes bacterium]|nr:nicotinate-nucleotide adenylyltransferase [Bacillota bacterium]
MRKIGILGGSFDPVHNGHIGLARDAKEQLGLDEVLMIPAKFQPFKLDRKMVSGQQRLEMIELAVADMPGITACDYELRQEEISYTYKTLKAITEMEGPETEVYFLTGTDSILQIHRWKNADELLHNYNFVVGSRPGYKDDELSECIERLKRDYNTNITKVDNHQLNISSTEIRERLESGQGLSGLVPEVVERYIIKHGLYK